MTQISLSAAADIPGFRDALRVLAPAESEADAIDRIRQLEELKSACAAAQARETAALEQRRAQAEAARGVAKARRCKGLAAEIGLARRESPHRGGRYLRLATALAEDLPNTMQALQDGQIREEHAQVVLKETSWLSAGDRRVVDAHLADQLGAVGVRKLEALAKAQAQRLDQAGAVERNARARSERHVSVRPAAEGMAYLSALVPMQQGVAMFARLRRDATTMVGTGETADPADPTGQPRTRDQIMADLLVLHVTGQTTAAAVPAEVHVVMTDAALFGHGDTPAWITGHGPIPAWTAKQWLADPDAQVFLRRVFTRPEDHQLVGLDSRSRVFPAGLRRMVMLRDDTCRAPMCDAPIRDIDHITPARNGGTTSWTNASGLCAACNQTKENTGWTHQGDRDRLTVTTPTGHEYTSTTTPVWGDEPLAKHPPPDDETPPGPEPPPRIIFETDNYRRNAA